MNRDKELGTLDLASRYKHCSTMTNSGIELDNFDFGKEDLRKADKEEKEILATGESLSKGDRGSSQKKAAEANTEKSSGRRRCKILIKTE